MKKISILLSLTLLLAFFTMSFVACGNGNDDNGNGQEELADGTYNVEASLSCYVPAMGGVEFGQPLMTALEIVKEGENYTLRIHFTKSSVTIYTVTCYTFVNTTPTSSRDYYAMAVGTIGYYTAEGTFVTDGVKCTLSEDTAPDPMQVDVHYVELVEIPVDGLREEYRLSLYIDSNVMGVQFCEKSSITNADYANYSAILTVDLDSMTEAK